MQQLILPIPLDMPALDGLTTTTALENYFIVSCGLQALHAYRQYALCSAETDGVSEKKRMEQDILVVRQTVDACFDKERGRTEERMREMQLRLDQMDACRLKNAALEQELVSTRAQTQLLVQKAVAEHALLHQSQSDLSKTAEARALKEANDVQQRAIQQLIAEVHTLKQTVSTNRSNDQGKSGEYFFERLAETAFHDFVPRFSMANTAGTPHSGDFHLKSDSLTVMVDCKKYRASKVGREEKQKLKDDLQRHAHIKVGWMVCLDQPFANAYSHLPFSFELENDICICYINSLESYGDAAQKIQLLRTVWTLSTLLHNKMMQRTTDSVQMDHLRQKEASVEQQIHGLIRSKKEMSSVIKQLKTLSERQDAELNQLLLTLTPPVAAQETPVVQWHEQFLSWFKGVARDKAYNVASLHRMFRKSCSEDVKLAEFKQFVRGQPSIVAVDDSSVPHFTVKHI